MEHPPFCEMRKVQRKRYHRGSVLPLGTVIDGRYRLERVIGSGGMGVVFAATHLGLGRAVALKIVRPDQADDAKVSARLVREARTVATLRSRHVAQVIDVGMHAGSPFLVMELLDGRTLQDIVTHDGALSASRAVDLVIQACHALDEAHRRGIVHRDVKPSNLFVTAGELKVIDFGISKRAPAQYGEAAGQTTDGTLLGSPSFMSPEQIRSSSDVDGRTDIWSLGVVLHFLVTGEKPFRAESLLDLMTLIVHDPPPSLTAGRPGVPAGLADVVAKCLRKARGERYETAAALARALGPFASKEARDLADGMPASSRSPDVTAAATPEQGGAGRDADVTETGTATESLSARRPDPGRRFLSPALALALVVGVIVTVAFGARALRAPRRTGAAAESPSSVSARAAESPPAETVTVAAGVRSREAEPVTSAPTHAPGRPAIRPRSRGTPRAAASPSAPPAPAKPELPSTPD
jgi:serine/threonine-protein kinase